MANSSRRTLLDSSQSCRRGRVWPRSLGRGVVVLILLLALGVAVRPALGGLLSIQSLANGVFPFAVDLEAVWIGSGACLFLGHLP